MIMIIFVLIASFCCCTYANARERRKLFCGNVSGDISPYAVMAQQLLILHDSSGALRGISVETLQLHWDSFTGEYYSYHSNCLHSLNSPNIVIHQRRRRVQGFN